MPTDTTADLANGISLAYDTFGEPTDPTIVLLGGLGQIRQGWQRGFIDQLIGLGLQVVRYDQRDSGASTHLDGAPVPDPRAVAMGDLSDVAYDLSDLAGDLVGLLDELGVEQAHVLGTSFGGMVAQVFAARHPHRMRSLTSWMSTPFWMLSRPNPQVMDVLMTPAGPTREDVVSHTLTTYSTLAGAGFPIDTDAMTEYGHVLYEVGPDPRGVGRQNTAVVASGDRRDEVATIAAPTLVLHGDKDPLMDPVCGQVTAELIEDAKLVVLAGAGHTTAKETWPIVVSELDELMGRA